MYHASISSWLASFAEACAQNRTDPLALLFSRHALWRDYLAFDATLQTLEGVDLVTEFFTQQVTVAGLSDISVSGDATATEGTFTFLTRIGRGRGYLRLENGVCTTLFTSLLELSVGSDNTLQQSDNTKYFVLVVGGGQSGLALGAQLSHLNVPYLIIDKYPRVGDQWRSRYESLVLHDPVWFDHLPFIPYPDSWPVFTPKDQMGDWLEHYAKELRLNISTCTSLINAQFSEKSNQWTARVSADGAESVITATHLVMALGLSGFPHVPSFKGADDFTGSQIHSSEFTAGADMQDANVVVVGANNSAHDIASNLVSVGANPVMLQRSSTLVVKQSVYCNQLLGKLYSKEAVERGITVDEADFLFTSVPMRLLEQRHKDIWKAIQQQDKDFYQQLTDAGFAIDFAEDGTGLGLKYRRTASGYYINVGASEMVIDGRIQIRSGINIERLTENHVVLDSGELIPADMVVYATGYGNMVDWVAKLIDKETAERVGPCWGYGSGTKGDPGPWQGELRNMWKPTAQKGLWFMGGNLAQVRYYSRILALQLQADLARHNLHHSSH